MRTVKLDSLSMIRVARALNNSGVNPRLGRYIHDHIASMPAVVNFTFEFEDADADEVMRVHKLIRKYAFTNPSDPTIRAIGRLKQERSPQLEMEGVEPI